MLDPVRTSALSELHMFDGRLLSTLGWTQEDVDALRGACRRGARRGGRLLGGLPARRGRVRSGHRAQGGNSLTSGINVPGSAGRASAGDRRTSASWTRGSFEVERHRQDGAPVGEQLRRYDRPAFAYREYTIVGVANSPIYINYERGGTSLGNGTVSAFVYLPEDGFTLDDSARRSTLRSQTAGGFIDEYKAGGDAMEEPLQTLRRRTGTAAL